MHEWFQTHENVMDLVYHVFVSTHFYGTQVPNQNGFRNLLGLHRLRPCARSRTVRCDGDLHPASRSS